MTVERLDHCTVMTSDLEATRRFYVDVLGLVDGARPPFKVAGAWLYGGGQPIVHLVVRDHAGGGSTGAFDHIAFRGSGLAGFVARLRDRGVEHSLHTVPDLGLRQIFVADPNGVSIEINFAADEPLPDDS